MTWEVGNYLGGLIGIMWDVGWLGEKYGLGEWVLGLVWWHDWDKNEWHNCIQFVYVHLLVDAQPNVTKIIINWIWIDPISTHFEHVEYGSNNFRTE